MRRILPTLIILLAISGTAGAQTLAGPTGLSVTSPLGVPGTSAMPQTGLMPGMTVIPLAATELNPGGLSPMPPSCPLAGSSATFDGGGLAGCTANAQTMMNALPPQTIPAPGTATLIGGAIPLGSTEINNAGLSPTIIVPGTTSTTMPAGTMMTGPGMTPGFSASGMTPSLMPPSTTPCTGTAGSTNTAFTSETLAATC